MITTLSSLVQFITPSTVLLVDANTQPLYARFIQPHFAGGALPSVVVVPGEPVVANEATAQWVQAHTSAADRLIALGSGTLNDLAKLASYRMGISYGVIPTAPSMNGYVSANASIADASGYKRTMPAHVPDAVFVDADLLATAPVRLILAGVGDAMCLQTCRADWYLSYLLFDTPYDESLFAVQEPYRQAFLEAPDAVVQGDADAIANLMCWLLASGMAMTAAGGSYPASQGEHMIAHMMEMCEHHVGEGASDVYHGEAIAITTLTMTRLIERVLKHASPPSLRFQPPDSAGLQALLGEQQADGCLAAYDKKQLTPAHIDDIAQRLQSAWGQLQAHVQDCWMPADGLESLFKQLKLPTKPHAVGWNASDYKQCVAQAHLMRDRFTFLDIANFTNLY